MKNALFVSLFMISSILLFSNCENEKTDIPVDFEFRLLNVNGEPSTVFKEGEDLIFSFIIVNKSKNQLYLKAITDMDDFFKVFDLSSRQENGELISLGKPYKAVHCEYVNGYIIPSLDTLKIEIPWVPKENNIDSYPKIMCNYKYDNSYIAIGEYTTNFTSTFVVNTEENEFETEMKSFKINFTVN